MIDLSPMDPPMKRWCNLHKYRSRGCNDHHYWDRLARGAHSNNRNISSTRGIRLGDEKLMGCPSRHHIKPHQHTRSCGRGVGRWMRGYGQYGPPFLADPHFVAKAAAGQGNTITPCRLQQACLTTPSAEKLVRLVNPRACYETELPMTKTDAAKRVAVIGAALLVWPPR